MLVQDAGLEGSMSLGCSNFLDAANSKFGSLPV